MERYVAHYLRLAGAKKLEVDGLFNLGKTGLDLGSRFVGNRKRLTKVAYEMRDMSYYEDVDVPEDFTLVARSGFDR